MILGRRVGPQYPDPIGILNAQYGPMQRGGISAPAMTTTTPMPPEPQQNGMGDMVNMARFADGQTGLLGYGAANANPFATSADVPLAAFDSGLVGGNIADYGGEMAGFFTPEALAPAGLDATGAAAYATEFGGIAPAVEAASVAPAVEAGLGAAAAEGAVGAEAGLLGASTLGPAALGLLGVYGVGKLFNWW